MKVIIAEKPSVARDIARALGGAKQEKGYLKVGEYAITWAFGHLLEIDDKVAPQKWDLENLPILPEKFFYKPNGKTAVDQLKVIKELLKNAQEVQIWTDPGREGELIARLILNHCGWKGKTLRMWTSEALTKEVVLRELRNLKPAQDFDSLYYSALARQHSDWIVGINLTRTATLKAKGRELWSVGRVQTPTLALVVQRDLEIENFKPVPYGIVKAIFSKEGKKYEATLLPNQKALRDKPDADTDDDEKDAEEDQAFRLSPEKAFEIVERLKSLKTGEVVKVEKKLLKEPPPLLHSLTSLQREANKLYGFSASKTLALAQSLYEKGYISYPRSDAQHLAESTKPLVKKVLKDLGRQDLIGAVDAVGKRVFDDAKLTDHHAIIPLRQGQDLTGDEKKVYDLLLRKFLGAFMPEYTYELTKVFTELGGYVFFTQGKRDVNLGWKSLYKEDLKEVSLPPLKQGDEVLKEKLWAEKRQTKPPPHYTEATLLKVMEKLSLGTPATRASIIDTLKTREYIKLQGKSLIATQKGKELIQKLQGSQVSSPEMTSQWERKLESIYKQRQGFNGYKTFLEEIKAWTVQEVESMKNKTFEKKQDLIGTCPLCKGQVVELPKSYQCQSCKANVWKTNFGKTLSQRQAIDLLSGKEVLVKGLKNKQGKSFNAYLKWQDGKVLVSRFWEKRKHH